MRNKYEFNIEDIHDVTATGGELTIKYHRISDSEFVETFHANPVLLGVDDRRQNKKGRYEIVCPRCGTWNVNWEDYKPTISLEDFECDSCDKDYRELHSEEEMIHILLSFMEKDTFESTDITINDIPIV